MEGQGGAQRYDTGAYDTLGNMTQRSTVNADGQSNPAEEFYEKWLGGNILYGTNGRPHAFVQASDGSGRVATADYDDNGNIVQLTVSNPDTGGDVQFQYEWDHYNRLVRAVRVRGGDVIQTQYTYDYEDRRVARRDDRDARMNDTLYVTAGFEVRNDGEERYVFDGETRVARVGMAAPYEGNGPANTRLAYVADHLGSSSLVVNDTPGGGQGCVAGTTSYLPYGGIERQSGPACGAATELWYRFAGKELEESFGFYYFGTRYYNPALARWMSVARKALFATDGGEQPYAYGNNNPYTFEDLDGDQATASSNVKTDAGELVRDPDPKVDQLVKSQGFEQNLVKFLVSTSPWKGAIRERKLTAAYQSLVGGLKQSGIPVGIWPHLIATAERENFLRRGSSGSARNIFNAFADTHGKDIAERLQTRLGFPGVTRWLKAAGITIPPASRSAFLKQMRELKAFVDRPGDTPAKIAKAANLVLAIQSKQLFYAFHKPGHKANFNRIASGKQEILAAVVFLAATGERSPKLTYSGIRQAQNIAQRGDITGITAKFVPRQVDRYIKRFVAIRGEIRRLAGGP